MRFVQLPNKLVVDADNIAYIVNPELNVYVIVPKQSISPTVPKLDGNEFDALTKFLEVTKLEVEKPKDERPSLIQRVNEDKQTVKVS